MKRKIILFTMALFMASVLQAQNTSGTPQSPRPFKDITATQLVSEIKIGWNLGNTLETAPLTGTSQFWAKDGEWSTFSANPTVAQMETAWYSPITTKATITTMKNAGFNAIRIPVSWLKAADSNQNIRADWMARVVEVVNYAVENDMYIILNSHHDEMEHFDLSNKGVESSLTKFKKMWEQIAFTFKNYDEKLIFEALNEPRNSAKGPNEWVGSNEAYKNLNRHYQSFVDIVRASGGNNDKRFLMVTPFAAFSRPGEINGLVIPKDTVQNKIIVSIHMYYPHSFTTDNGTDTWSKNKKNDTKPITDGIDLAYNTFVSKGIPVIIDEFGTVEKKNNTSARAEWSEFVASYAKNKNMPCFYWEEGDSYGIFNRVTNRIIYPEIFVAIMRGAGLSTNMPAPVSNSTASFMLTKNGDWGWQFYKIFLDPLLFNINGGKVTQGDKYTFTYSFTSNVAIDYLQVVLIDTIESTGWKWNELSSYIKIKENIAANTVVSGSITIKATKTATNSSHGANRLVFQAGKGTVSAPILTFTKFEIKKE